MIAALYVETDGAYFGLPDVDPWDENRDARQYAGPWPGRHSLVWACADRNACTRRARQIAARRVSEPGAA